MKLIYRATSFDYIPKNQAFSVEQPTREAYELCYRGRHYQIDPQAPSEDVSASYTLCYRGITYVVERAANGSRNIASYSGQASESISLACA
jgi:Domain of unknown function (DUF4278)